MWNGSNEAIRQHQEAVKKTGFKGKRKTRTRRQRRRIAYEKGEIASPRADGKPKPQKKPHVDYQHYMKSPKWFKFRRLAIRVAGGKCQRCGATKNLEVHHKTYERLGHELLSDVEVLCKWCHGDIHLAEALGVTVEALEEYAVRRSHGIG